VQSYPIYELIEVTLYELQVENANTDHDDKNSEAE
jgi:hypothetical protein